MPVVAPERRKVAILSGEQRIDLALPADGTLENVLVGLGYGAEPGRHVLLGHSGQEIALSTPVEQIPDGALYAIVDLRAAKLTSGSPTGKKVATVSPALWWMLGAVTVIAVAISLIDGNGMTFSAGPLGRMAASLTLAIAAASCAIVWALRQSSDNPAAFITMLSPFGLAFAAGALSVPLSLNADIQFHVVAGFMAASILGGIITAAAPGLRLRSASGTATVISCVLAGIWGVTLLVGWDAAAAAAISVGAVPLGLRALPSTLVNLPEGHHIDYGRFMSNRWTVRGAIPESPGQVKFDAVRDVVNGSMARLITGTVLMSAGAVVLLPVALRGHWMANLITHIGMIVLATTVAIALLLYPRNALTPVLRWVPRIAAGIIGVEIVVVVAQRIGSPSLAVSSLCLLAASIIGATALVLIGRGARSMLWSRLAEMMEWPAIALSLPAGLMAANAIALIRGMVST